MYSILGVLFALWLTVTKVVPALQSGFFGATVWSVAIVILALGFVGFWLMKWWSVTILLAAALIQVFFALVSELLYNPMAVVIAVIYSVVAFGPAVVIARIYQDRFRA